MLQINRRLIEASWEKFRLFAVQNRLFLWVGLGVLIAALLIIPTSSAAMTPNNILYPIKRGGESVVAALAPTKTIRARLKLSFANRRIIEAFEIVNEAGLSRDVGNLSFLDPTVVHAATNTATNEGEVAKTVNQLLASFEKSYTDATTILDESLNINSNKPSSSDVQVAQKAAVSNYAKLVLLRLQAPGDAQLSILTSIDATQNYLASTADILSKPPISSSDLSQLSKLIPAGILSKSDVNALANNQLTNRQLHAKLESLINSGQLPSDIIYRLDQDLVKQVAPDQVANFEIVAEFEQMRRISATVQASRPTAEQQKAIQKYLSQYKVGQTVPQNDIKSFVTPIVYGMTLAGELQSDLGGLKTVGLTSNNQALLDSWEGNLATNQENLGQLYQQFMTKAANQPDLYLGSLIEVQEELVAAEKANVSHLVLPPGWGADQLTGLDRSLGVQVAEAKFLDAKPNTETQLASVTVTQQQLQATLNALTKNQITNTTNLETKVKDFTGTPEQVTELKALVASLTQSQTDTVSELQSQLTDMSKVGTQLSTSLKTLTKEQLIALTELELRAASNAQTLSAATTTALSAQLTQLETTSQSLIDSLQNKVDALDDGQFSLREELTADIQTVQANYTALAAYTQAEIATGRAATDQLQSQLQTAQASLTTHATQLTQLSSTTSSLTELIHTVSTDSSNQVDQLQTQLTVLTIDQQALHTSIDGLQTQQAAALQDMAGQLANLNTLQVEANAAIATITQTQTSTQSTLAGLTNDFAGLEEALAITQQAYDTIATTIADQQIEFSSFKTQTQSAITQVTAQQAQLTTQVSSLTNNAASLSQTVASLQTTSTSTQAQLDTLLANPPWSIIPEGTYVTQAQFDTLQSSIDAQFATKSATLDQQFQAFQQTVNAEVSQLNTTVTNLQTTVTNQGTQATQQATEQAQLKQTVTTLQSQVATLQAQVQALSGAGL